MSTQPALNQRTTTISAFCDANDAKPNRRSWQDRYGKRHRLERLIDFPEDIRAPIKVRIYRRRDHFVLQWWDPSAKKNLAVRVGGDLIDALGRAREIDLRLLRLKTAGIGVGNLRHLELVDRYIADLHHRADAGEITPATVTRYANALAHFGRFTGQPAIEKQFPSASLINRDFRLSFATYLERLQIITTGASQIRRPLLAKSFVLDTVRSMFEWAADPNRGHLLPNGFANPFRRIGQRQRIPARDPFGEPDVTITMATDFLEACDNYLLPLFSTMMLYGLRAAEPVHLFREHVENGWLKVSCLPELGYLTKGKRDKRFPLAPTLQTLWSPGPDAGKGLLFTRRRAGIDCQSFPWFGASLATLAAEFQRRCREVSSSTATARQRIRDEVIRAAGGLNYDCIEHEFKVVSRRLAWPRQATLKDFRHLFSTSLENAGIGEFYRKYFMGQSPGRAPIATYTHLNRLEVQYHKALAQDLAPLIAVISKRLHGQA